MAMSCRRGHSNKQQLTGDGCVCVGVAAIRTQIEMNTIEYYCGEQTDERVCRHVLMDTIECVLY